MSDDSRCEMCGDTGIVQVERIEFVTRGMAIDAGTPEMEGQPMPCGSEDMPCPACMDTDSSMGGGGAES